MAAAGARRRRERAGIPDEVRHREKWRLALDMIGEMTGPGGWDLLDLVAGAARPVVAADIGYGDNALFREQLTPPGGSTRSRSRAAPRARPRRAAGQAYGGRASPPRPPTRTAGDLAPARVAAANQVQPVTWRQGTKRQGQPRAVMTGCFLAIRARPASRHITRDADRAFPACWLLAE